MRVHLDLVVFLLLSKIADPAFAVTGEELINGTISYLPQPIWAYLGTRGGRWVGGVRGLILFERTCCEMSYHIQRIYDVWMPSTLQNNVGLLKLLVQTGVCKIALCHFLSVLFFMLFPNSPIKSKWFILSVSEIIIKTGDDGTNANIAAKICDGAGQRY